MGMSPSEYDRFYDNTQGRRENEEIARIIRRHIPTDETITDVGCGTGLGYALSRPNPYVGIDPNQERIAYARARHRNHNFYTRSLEDWIKNAHDFEHVIALFSLDHINPKAVEELVRKTRGTLIATTYAEPWLEGSSSEYAGERERYVTEAPHTKEVEKILERAGAHKTRLLEQPYYNIHIIK